MSLRTEMARILEGRAHPHPWRAAAYLADWLQAAALEPPPSESARVLLFYPPMHVAERVLDPARIFRRFVRFTGVETTIDLESCAQAFMDGSLFEGRTAESIPPISRDLKRRWGRSFTRHMWLHGLIREADLEGSGEPVDRVAPIHKVKGGGD